MGRESPRPSAPPAPATEPARPTLEIVYRSSLTYVLGLLWRFGIASRDREDVAHEVFLVVARRLGDYDPASKLRSWLAGITWNVARRWRDLARHHRLELGMDDTQHESGREAHPDPEQIVSDAEVMARLRELTRALLQTVPEERRIVVLLHDIDGMGMPDIARGLGIPEGTGWDRLQRGRRDFEAAVKRLAERERDALGESGIRRLIPLLIPFDVTAMPAWLREPPDVPPGLEARLLERIRCSIADLPLPAKPAAPTASAGLPVHAGAKLAAWSVLVFLLGGATGALSHLLAVANRETEPAPAVTRAEVVAASATDAASALPAPTESALVVATAVAPASAASAASMPATPIEIGDADSDGGLMKRAGAALNAGQAAASLTLLQRHAQKYPRSARGQEREALFIQTLAVLPGRRAEALDRAERFRQASPGSMFLPSIDAALRVAQLAR
ncbi:MAG: sigma-70 family RNA polymerase sigma factor [Byssovorax sp.]